MGNINWGHTERENRKKKTRNGGVRKGGVQREGDITGKTKNKSDHFDPSPKKPASKREKYAGGKKKIKLSLTEKMVGPPGQELKN